MYTVTLQIAGKWEQVTREFPTYAEASEWASDVLATGPVVHITGYRLTRESVVICSVEKGAK